MLCCPLRSHHDCSQCIGWAWIAHAVCKVARLLHVIRSINSRYFLLTSLATAAKRSRVVSPGLGAGLRGGTKRGVETRKPEIETPKASTRSEMWRSIPSPVVPGQKRFSAFWETPFFADFTRFQRNREYGNRRLLTPMAWPYSFTQRCTFLQ